MLRRVRGFADLLHDALDLTLDLVDVGHESAARNVVRGFDVAGAGQQARALDSLRRVATRGVLGTIRGVNQVVRVLTQAGLDPALAARLAPALAARRAEPIALRSDVLGTRAHLGDVALGAVNGAIGDHLHREKNGLDLGFSLRHRDRYLAPGEGARVEGRRAVVLVHGLGTTEWSWCFDSAEYHGDPSATFGTLLERDLGLVPLYARYNSGRPIADNGAELAASLVRLERERAPFDEIVLLGHSMGGLVVRSACAHAEREGHAWLARVRRVVALGAPHQGAPLEKASHLATSILGAIDLPGTLIPARLLERRSAGVRDLRHGTIAPPEWLEHDPDATREPSSLEVPLVAHITYCFVSATLSRDPEHPVGKLVGDLLVRVPSASGPRLTKHAFAIETACFGGVAHHRLQNHPDVYAQVKRALGEPLG